MRSDDPPDAVGRDRDDQYDDPEAADPSFWSGYPAAGWWPPDFYGSDAVADEAQSPDDGAYPADDEWWETGVATLLIVLGAVLFLVPEPATSVAGILLVGTGVVLWLVDRFL